MNEVLFDDIFVYLMCEETGPEEPSGAKAYLSGRRVIVRFLKN